MKKILQCSWIIVLSFSIISLISCGGGDGPFVPPVPPSIVFNVEWENIPPIPAASRALSSNTYENIKYVQVNIYQGYYEGPYVSKVFEYNTNTDSFSILVPKNDYNISIQLDIIAKDGSNNLLYYGAVKGIIIANSTIDLGTVRARSLIPKLYKPADGATIERGHFSWSSIRIPYISLSSISINSYQIQISNDSSFLPILVNEKQVYNPYFGTSLAPGKYYWRIRGEPGTRLENKYPWSDAGSFDLVEDTNPKPPHSLLAKAEDNKISIHWDTYFEAESYNIYYSYEPGVLKHKYFKKISNIIDSPYIHTGLTNGKTYYYILTSVNDTNESCESNEISATPSPWTISDTPKDIKYPLFLSSTPHIAIDPNNNFHSCKGSFEGLKYSINSSGSWVDYYLDDSTEFQSSSIAIDDNNKVHIIYRQGYWYNSSEAPPQTDKVTGRFS